jgi:hypothetical protein
MRKDEAMNDRINVNIIVPVNAAVTREQATALAPKGELTCGICEICSAIVPLYRLVAHGQRMHPEEG